MSCKYCHEENHSIDSCPNIICKKCNKQGHPQWLCKEKKKNNQYFNKSKDKDKDKDKDKELSKKYNSKNMIEKNSLERNNKAQKEQTDLLIEENKITYYIDLEKNSWGSIIMNNL